MKVGSKEKPTKTKNKNRKRKKRKDKRIDKQTDRQTDRKKETKRKENDNDLSPMRIQRSHTQIHFKCLYFLVSYYS